jgi:hypothetical protein
MPFVSDDTIPVAERAGAIRVVRNGVVEPQPAQGGPSAQVSLVNFEKDAPAHPAIVSLWKFEMLTKGTELMNSGSRDPKDGDFCQGVWTQVGPLTFELLHYPLAWANGAYTGPVVLRVRVTVDRSGEHYTGVFSGTAYLASPTAGHEFDETTPLGTITGTIAATRITVD